MDDFDYLDRMVAAGFLDYCDCVGAHHNGINMPPDVAHHNGINMPPDVAWDDGYNDPTATFRGPFDNPDHSWSFKSTLWGYHDRIAAAGSAPKDGIGPTDPNAPYSLLDFQGIARPAFGAIGAMEKP